MFCMWLIGGASSPFDAVGLKWSTTTPGVIQYNWSKLNNDEVNEIRKGPQEGRYTWVDLTEADVQQYAEKCAEFSEMYAMGAEKLYKIQMATDFVVAIIGDATMMYLSPGLAPGKKVQPGARPNASRMAPNTSIPKSPPAINAPSLGSNGAATVTGSVHATPRSASPGKTPSTPTNVSPN